MGIFDKFKKESVSGKTRPAGRPQKETATAASKQPSGEYHGILERPVLGEKATFLETSDQYIFQVIGGATKSEVCKAVERIFGVKVEKVNIMNRAGKTKFLRGHLGQQAGFRKAIVKLRKGDKIEVIPH